MNKDEQEKIMIVNTNHDFNRGYHCGKVIQVCNSRSKAEAVLEYLGSPYIFALWTVGRPFEVGDQATIETLDETFGRGTNYISRPCIEGMGTRAVECRDWAEWYQV